MLPFQRLLNRRERWDTTGEPLSLVPDFDEWLSHYYDFETDGSDVVGSVDITLSAGGGPSMSASPGCAYSDGAIYDGSTWAQSGTSASTISVAASGNVLVSGWFEPDVSGIVAFGNAELFGLNGKLGFGAYNVGDGTYQVRAYAAGVWQSLQPGARANGTLVHLAGFWDINDERVLFAVDGALVQSGYQLIGAGTHEATFNTGLSSPAAFQGDGEIDEVAIWLDISPTLSAAKFAALAGALYNDGNGVFYNGANWIESV